MNSAPQTAASQLDRLATNVGPQDGATPQQWAALVFVDAGRPGTAFRDYPDAARECLAKGWIVRGGETGYQLGATAPRTVQS